MEKGLLKKEYMDDIDSELLDLSLMRDYLQKSNRTDVEFSQLRAVDNLTLIDGGIKIPDILVMQNTKGKTDIMRKNQKTYEPDEIEQIMQQTGLERKDIIALMQDGMQLEKISEAADNLPFKEIADSAAIREMIRKDIRS